MSDAYWTQPFAWDRAAHAAGERARVFCASMADVFEDRDDLDPMRERLWDVIGRTPNLDWLLLSKRPQHVGRMVPWGSQWPDNVWLGTTIESQRWAQRRAPLLLQYSARIRFVSCEPLLTPLDLAPWFTAPVGGHAIDWVIAGGESGHGARPMNPGWTRALRDQSAAYSVPFLFKQWGNWCPAVPGAEAGSRVRLLKTRAGTSVTMASLGKKAAGRLLDGREWNEVPNPPARPLIFDAAGAGAGISPSPLQYSAG